jgi:predicted Zn-dependent protease
MAHVERRHILKSMAGGLGRLAGLVTISLFFGSDSAALISKGTDLISLKYSRDDETEADLRGLEFIQAARINPEGMATFFEKLAKESSLGGNIESVVSLVSTHPASEQRQRALREKFKNSPVKFQTLPFKLSDFQKH